MREWAAKIQDKDAPRINRFCSLVGDEVEKLLIPVPGFFEKEKRKRIGDANRSRAEALLFIKNYKKRIGIHVKEYMKIIQHHFLFYLQYSINLSVKSLHPLLWKDRFQYMDDY